MLRSFVLAGSFRDGIGVEILSPVDHEGPSIFFYEDKSIEKEVRVGDSSDDLLIDVTVKRLLPGSILHALRDLYPDDEVKVTNLEVGYWISGYFYEGMEWEDFLGLEGAPNVTINLDGSVVESVITYCPDDGWYDVLVSCVDIDQAKAVLGQINGVDAEYVQIEERRTCPAV